VAVSPRDKAIDLLKRAFHQVDVAPADFADIVDALIEAARAPESPHTRAVQEATGATTQG
jgi:hypothetical protein